MDFDGKFLISHLILKNLFDQPQIKGSYRITLRQYHQQLKTFNAWLILIRYETCILPNKNLTKTVTCLPHFLRQDFLKDTRDIDLTGSALNLIRFEKWLEKKLKFYLIHLRKLLQIEIVTFSEKILLKVNMKISEDIQLMFFIPQITNYRQTKVQLRKAKEKMSPK